jgi:hypothetical protein
MGRELGLTYALQIVIMVARKLLFQSVRDGSPLAPFPLYCYEGRTIVNRQVRDSSSSKFPAS